MESEEEEEGQNEIEKLGGGSRRIFYFIFETIPVSHFPSPSPGTGIWLYW